MSWEQESTEPDLDDEGGGGKKNIIKIAIIAVGALVVLAGLYFGISWWLNRPSDGPAEETTQAQSNEDGAVDEDGEPDPEMVAPIEEADDEEETGHLVQLKPFLLDVDDEGQARYMRLSVSVRVSTQDLRDALLDRNRQTRIEVRLALIDHLGALTYRQVRNADARREAANELRHKLNQRYKDLGKFNRIILSEEG